MAVDAVSIALSGIASASRRLSNSAHNTANLLTGDFHPLRTLQHERADGGVEAETRREARARPVDPVEEFVSQRLATLQAKASARVADTALELRGTLIDLFG